MIFLSPNIKAWCKIVPVIFLFVTFACSSKHGEPAKKCIDLNNEGTEHLMDPDPTGNNVTKAIAVLEQAVACDTTYITAYINLATAYGRAQNYTHQLHTLNKLLVLSHLDPEIYVSKAEVFIETHQTDSLNHTLQLAMKAYNERLAKRPEDSNLISGKVWLIKLMHGTDAAIQELDKQIKLHPALASKLSENYSLLDIDSTFLNGEVIIN